MTTPTQSNSVQFPNKSRDPRANRVDHADYTDCTDYADNERTLHEASPSTGWRETAEILDVPDAHAVEPVDAYACGALGCHADEDLRRVDCDGRERVLCPDHARDFLDTDAPTDREVMPA